MGGRGTSSSGSIGGRGHQDFGGDWGGMYNQLDADLKRANVTDISPEDVQEAIVDWSGGGYHAIWATQRGEEHPDAWSMTADQRPSWCMAKRLRLRLKIMLRPTGIPATGRRCKIL